MHRKPPETNTRSHDAFIVVISTASQIRDIFLVCTASFACKISLRIMAPKAYNHFGSSSGEHGHQVTGVGSRRRAAGATCNEGHIVRRATHHKCWVCAGYWPVRTLDGVVNRETKARRQIHNADKREFHGTQL